VLSLPLAAAVLTVLGGVTALAARDGRIAVLGLMLAATASVAVASPLPGTPAVLARVLGALLAGYLLWTAARGGVTGGSPIGPAAEIAAAAAAFVMGLAIRPVDPLLGPVEAQAAGLALIVLAVAPLAGRDVIRMGMGVLLLILGGSLEMSAWGGTTCSSIDAASACAIPDLEQLAVAALLAGTAGAVCLLAPSGTVAAEEASASILDLWAPEPALPAASGGGAGAESGPGPLRRPTAAEPASPTSARHRAPVAAPKTVPPVTPASSKGPSAPAAHGPAAPALKGPASPPSPTPAPPAQTAGSSGEAAGSGRGAAKPAAEPGQAEARPAPRPMTADPLEFDDWLAWSAPQPEPRPKRRQWRGRKPQSPHTGKDETP
jgi:hypothetical protein